MILYLSRSALESARAHFEEAGSRGCEGTGMLAGARLADGWRADRFFAPEQRASAGPGVWVEVTERGKAQIATALRLGELWIARIHSHPGAAFHSATDDGNPVITAEGSWSIVVPYFGLGLRRGAGACAFFIRQGGRWREVATDDVERCVRVVA